MPVQKFVARSNHQLGFTRVELLVVLAIIAILAAMLLPALSRAKQTAQSAPLAVKPLANQFWLYHVR